MSSLVESEMSENRMFCWPSQKLITNLLLNLLRIPDSAKFDASHQQNVKSEKQEIIYDVE